MKENLCFKIDNSDLFLEHVLVEIDYIPIFYTCKDSENNKYIVMCIDIDEETYIVAKTSNSKILDMLKGTITMRKIIVSASDFWEVIASDDFENDEVKKISVSEIADEILPIENGYYESDEIDIKEYINDLEKILYSGNDRIKNLNLNFHISDEIIYSSVLHKISSGINDITFSNKGISRIIESDVMEADSIILKNDLKIDNYYKSNIEHIDSKNLEVNNNYNENDSSFDNQLEAA